MVNIKKNPKKSLTKYDWPELTQIGREGNRTNLPKCAYKWLTKKQGEHYYSCNKTQSVFG